MSSTARQAAVGAQTAYDIVSVPSVDGYRTPVE
jgi:hypothetical protein